jgi:ketosteroid isomerase-like protein
MEAETARMAIVRRLYEVFDAARFDEEPFDADVEYVNPPDAIEPGTRRGVDEMREALESVREGFGEAKVEVERMEEAGERVAVSLSMGVRGPASGIEGAVPQSHLWTFRDEKVVRFEWSFDSDWAFEALGERPGA